MGMPVSLYLESDPGIICSFTGQKADAFYLAGGIDSFHGQFVDRALQSAPWNRKIQKNLKFFSRLRELAYSGRGISPESASDSAVREMNFIR